MAILLVLAFVPALIYAETPAKPETKTPIAETLVKPETKTPIEICPSCTAVRVLLVPDKDSRIKLTEAPKVEAAYFNAAAPRDAAKFPSNWIGKPFPRAIEIALDENETKQAGTYDLYLNLQPDSYPGAERLKIQLTRPAASLEAIPKLIINRTLLPSSASLPVLRATETSKKSNITISGVRPVSNSVMGTRAIGGTLGFQKEQPKIGPGDQVTLNYKLDGCFELGTATGTMKIDAPQLASPVSFDFEVRSRVHWIWIGITIFVALLISWMLKVFLQHTIELNQAILDADKLKERIKLEAGGHAASVYDDGCKDQLKKLDSAIDRRDATDINKYKGELDAKWQEVLKEHEKKHRVEEEALAKLRDHITNPDWLVPPDIFNAIVVAREGVASVEQLLKRCELGEASKKWKEIITGLGVAIRDGGTTWQDSEQMILKTIQSKPPGISAAFSADFAKQATDLLASLHKVDASTNLETIEQLQQALSDLKSERAMVKNFFNRLSMTIQEECQVIERIPAPPPADWNAATFAKAADAVKEFTIFLKTIVEKPDQSSLDEQLKKVHQAWTDALQGQFPSENGEVKAQLNTHDYFQATETAVRVKRGSPMAASKPAGPTYIFPPFYAELAGGGPPIYEIHTRYQTVTTPAPVVPTSVTAKGKLMIAKGIQSFIILVLLVVGGYGFQLNTFVGTFTDFSTLFFWAFALDLTVEQVGRIIKKP
jgi:hypothetical protein